jgi:hypothetical protein
MAEISSQLEKLASAIREAADRESWEEVNSLMQSFDKLLHSTNFTRQDKAKLLVSVHLINEAIGSATRRKDEIRNLVNQIGSSPL